MPLPLGISLAAGDEDAVGAQNGAAHIEVEAELDAVLYEFFVLIDVCLRAQQTLLLGAAPYEAQRSLGSVLQEVQIQTHQGCGTGSIVPCAGADGQAVVVADEYDGLFGLLGFRLISGAKIRCENRKCNTLNRKIVEK